MERGRGGERRGLEGEMRGSSEGTKISNMNPTRMSGMEQVIREPRDKTTEIKQNERRKEKII